MTFHPSTDPAPWSLDLDDGPLRGLRFGTGDHVAVALHGITANAMSWCAAGRHVPDDWSLIAVDLRGRGRSRDLPAPYDLESLARDAADVVAAVEADVLAGHSLGAYVAVAAEQLRPGLAERLVLVDGGLAIPLPDSVAADVDAVLEAVVGPMIDRLRTTFDDEDAYVDFFRAHPAMAGSWSDDFEAYARYDALPVDGGVRARALEEAVRASGRDLLVRGDEVSTAIAGLSVPTTLLRAERGMFDEPQPFMPDEAVAGALELTGLLEVVEVEDTNHYTVLVSDRAAARVVSTITGS